jgi:hypothetical protein
MEDDITLLSPLSRLRFPQLATTSLGPMGSYWSTFPFSSPFDSFPDVSRVTEGVAPHEDAHLLFYEPVRGGDELEGIEKDAPLASRD